MAASPSLIRKQFEATAAGPGLGLAVALAVSAGAFGFPFLVPQHGSEFAPVAPVLSMLVLGVVLLGITGIIWDGSISARRADGSKLVALLAALVAIDAVVRLVPSLAGASAIFPLIVLAGAVFGPRFGFLMGSLTILLSAVLIGGIGPWLPYQVLATGWVGAGAGLLPKPRNDRWWVRLLAAYGAFAGLGFGVLMSLSGWPLAAPGVGATDSLYWSPDLPRPELVRRYAAYYLATSFGHDLTRAVANAVLLALVGLPLSRLLERAKLRLFWLAG